MAATTRWRGHPIWHDSERNCWIYSDTKEAVNLNKNRACGHCGKCDTPEGHDGCLGTLPGVKNACCGHGDEADAYIQFPDGTDIRGEDAAKLFKELQPQQTNS